MARNAQLVPNGTPDVIVRNYSVAWVDPDGSVHLKVVQITIDFNMLAPVARQATENKTGRVDFIYKAIVGKVLNK